MKCASNLRQMGQGMMLFANDHKGRMPDTLGQMATEEALSPQVMLCPSSSSSVPADVLASTPEAIKQWIDTDSDYVYLAKGLAMAKMDPERVVAHEKLTNHPDGVNVLFADGHVQFVGSECWRRCLPIKARAMRGDPVPDKSGDGSLKSIRLIRAWPSLR